MNPLFVCLLISPCRPPRKGEWHSRPLIPKPIRLNPKLLSGSTEEGGRRARASPPLSMSLFALPRGEYPSFFLSSFLFFFLPLTTRSRRRRRRPPPEFAAGKKREGAGGVRDAFSLRHIHSSLPTIHYPTSRSPSSHSRVPVASERGTRVAPRPVRPCDRIDLDLT